MTDLPTGALKSWKGYTAEEPLRNGQTLRIRTLQESDREAIVEGIKRISTESSYFRFMSVRRQLSDEEIHYLTDVDFIHHVVLVATLDVDGQDTPVGGGRYIISDLPEGRGAEVAFIIEDPYHGLGIGTHLFQHMKKLAKASAVQFFFADVHEANKKMIDVFMHLDLPTTVHRDGSLLNIRMQI
ncbi:GCN5-related N-acetyltransferase [gamma proteobacterium HdN1]|nr:GCN5-related N-acetyltransferase [gamma proteobacterium HdN1]